MHTQSFSPHSLFVKNRRLKVAKHDCEYCQLVPRSLCKWAMNKAGIWSKSIKLRANIFCYSLVKSEPARLRPEELRYPPKYWHNCQRNSFCVNIDTAVKGIHLVWILTQQSKEFSLCEYWHNSQRNSFCVHIFTTIKGLHFVWILTQQSKQFMLCEYWHNSQNNSFCVYTDPTIKRIIFVYTDPTVKGIHFLWILTQRSKELILYEY